MDAVKIIDKDADKLVKIAAERARDYSKEYYKVGNFDFAIKFAEAAKKFDPDLPNIDIFIAAYRVTKAATPHNKRTNWYAVLDIQDPLTDLETIEKEYKRLDLMVGPNIIESLASVIARSLVRNAWDILSNPQKRLAYDYAMGFRSDDDDGNNNNNTRRTRLHKFIIHCSLLDSLKPLFVYEAHWPMCPY